MKNIIITIGLSIFTAALIGLLPVFASEITGGLSNQGIVPVAPSDVTAVKTGDQEITINWNAVAGVDGYRIYRKKDSGSFQLAHDNVTTLSKQDSGLVIGLYSYQVQSFVGTLSTDLDDILPTVPIQISATPTPTPSPSSTPSSTPTPTPTPTPASGGGGGGGGGFTSVATPTPLSEAAKIVDVNNDSKIDVMDFNALVINWGGAGSGLSGDFNSDGKVDIFDFNILMINWTG